METVFTIEVMPDDLDLLNHVNNGVYVSYLEHARMNWFDQMGIDIKGMVSKKLGIMVRRLEINYIKEAIIGDKLQIKTKPARLGHTSFTFEQKILNDQGDIITEATAVIVMIDLNERRSITVIDEIGQYFMAAPTATS